MNTAMTITRQFHTTRQRDGRQHLRPGPAPDTPQGKIPRLSRLMALAIHCDELLRTGQITNQSELAYYARITRARLTQILTLLNLAPDIQEQILFLPRTTKGRGEIQEKDIRQIAMELDWGRQLVNWDSRQCRKLISGLNHSFQPAVLAQSFAPPFGLGRESARNENAPAMRGRSTMDHVSDSKRMGVGHSDGGFQPAPCVNTDETFN